MTSISVRVLRELKPSSGAAAKENNNAKASYNRTPNQSFNDSFSGALDLRRPTVRKIDSDFFDVSNTSITNPMMNNNNNNASKPNNNKLDFEIYDDNLENDNNNGNFEVFSDHKSSSSTNTPFNGSRSSLSLSSTTSSSMITPSSHKSVSFFLFFLRFILYCVEVYFDIVYTLSTAVTPLTPLNENEAIEPYPPLLVLSFFK